MWDKTLRIRLIYGIKWVKCDEFAYLKLAPKVNKVIFTVCLVDIYCLGIKDAYANAEIPPGNRKD